MDGDPVTGEPSSTFRNDDGGAGKKNPAEITNFTEMFIELCPQYMAMGMSYDEFWNRNTLCHASYRKAWEQRRAQINWQMWMQGGYFYDALIKVAPVMRAALGKGRVQPGEYPSEPYPITAKEAREREEAKRRAKFEKMLAMMNVASECEVKRREDEQAELTRKEAKEDG